MSELRLQVKKLFDGGAFVEDKVLTLSGGKLVAIDNDSARADIRLDGLLVPGFVDLQVNGGGGVLFNANPTFEGVKTMLAAHAKFGTTAMLPTVITDKVEVMAQAAETVACLLKEGEPGLIGIHFEGPHLSAAKKGAHSQGFIREISPAEWQIYQRKDLGQIIVTLAPEAVAVEDIRTLVALGIKVCLGHSNADYQCVKQALLAGADGFTHLYNAMSPLQGREPGMVGAALFHDEASCGIIADGFHLDDVCGQLALKVKPQDKVFLVTDAMQHVGCEQKEFNFFDRKITLTDGKLTSTTGELAGSALDMATAVKNAHLKMLLPLERALQMASLNPASYINQGQLGRIRVGAAADFVELTEDFKVLSTWIAGHRIFTA
ncbi:N-acetylglucosamine-6-phosphate deacetylase [Thalassomonas actiniarum]|uniref:N-acetylgalactosamine-6-phosphate deacetylase n=1 Tax=Thalassomonas actiniarum TaxID=485447 RepID=A0AAE9YKX2_9GAMM|nr:N-acetylglucosamine-6-phosphate deacetylase [Thalassomonas actiniarum]WDD97385.1 N-acetylglucosamine-6-phosphate deacetylase [Thalassomonas actiniarum]